MNNCSLVHLTAWMLFLCVKKFTPATGELLAAVAHSGPHTLCQSMEEEVCGRLAMVSLCFARHSRPFNLCGHCLQTYYATKEHIRRQLTSQCDPPPLYGDVSMPTYRMMQNIEETWAMSHCQQCVGQLDNASSQIYSESANIFFDLLNSLQSCLYQYRDTSVRTLLNPTEIVWNSSLYSVLACSHCRDQYDLLTNYYKVMRHNAGRLGLCRDIVDAMNRTRTIWWYLYQCQIHPLNYYIAMLPLLCISIVMVIFYTLLANNVCGTVKNTKVWIYQDHRVIQVIHHDRDFCSAHYVSRRPRFMSMDVTQRVFLPNASSSC